MDDLIIQYAMKTSDNLIKNNLQPILEMLAGGLDRQITEDEVFQHLGLFFCLKKIVKLTFEKLT